LQCPLGMALRSLRLASSPLVLLALLAGCEGEISTAPAGSLTPGGDPGLPPTSPAMPTMPGVPGIPGTPTTPTTPTTPPPYDPCATTPEAPVPFVMRRLSNEELGNTLRALLKTSEPLEAAMPADNLVNDFDNHAGANTISTSRAQTLQTVIEGLTTSLFADATRRAQVVGCDLTGAAKATCLQSFLAKFGRRAFRRPLTADELSDLTAVAATTAGDTDPFSGARLVVSAMLQSPSFLLRPESGATDASHPGLLKLNGYERASRLAFLLFRSGPDDALLDLAANGGLDRDEDLVTVATTLLADPRAHAGLQRFTDQWLQLRAVGEVPPDTSVYPAWTPSLGAAMVEQTRRLVLDLAWRDGASLLELLTSTRTEVNGELAALYGLPAPAAGSWQAVTLDPSTTKRQGLLGQASFLTLTSKPTRISPLHRGLWIRRVLMCSSPPPPPPNVPAFQPAQPGETERQAFARHSQGSCAGCHNMMEPVGFGLSSFDGVGRFRTKDSSNAAIDESGFMLNPDGTRTAFVGPQALVNILKDDPQVPRCMTTQLFRYAYSTEERSADACLIKTAQDAFARSGHRFPSLVLAMVKSPAFGYRLATQGTP